MDMKMVPQMTLREYYAGLAMQALVSKGVPITNEPNGYFARHAEACFLIADAMVKEGQK